MAKQPRYYLEPLALTPATPPNVALEALVGTTGDTHGVIRILHSGYFELWRMGKRSSSFTNLNDLYTRLDKILS